MSFDLKVSWLGFYRKLFGFISKVLTKFFSLKNALNSLLPKKILTLKGDDFALKKERNAVFFSKTYKNTWLFFPIFPIFF